MLVGSHMRVGFMAALASALMFCYSCADIFFNGHGARQQDEAGDRAAGMLEDPQLKRSVMSRGEARCRR